MFSAFIYISQICDYYRHSLSLQLCLPAKEEDSLRSCDVLVVALPGFEHGLLQRSAEGKRQAPRLLGFVAKPVDLV